MGGVIMKNERSIHFFDEIADGLLNYLKSLKYSIYTIKKYKKDLKSIKKFIINNDFTIYNSEICMKYIEFILNGKTYAEIKRSKKDKIRCANAVLEHYKYGTISIRYTKNNKKLKGEIGLIIKKYLIYRKMRGISVKTLKSTKLYLVRFQDHLKSEEVNSISSLSQENILSFIKKLSLFSKATIHCTLCTLRVFFRYLYQEKIIDKDWSHSIPHDNYRKERKLPTTYTQKEIKNIINAIDRGNPKGKRDYAMILLVSTLGLRASDVCQMEFSNLKWKSNKICLKQKKTKKLIELPLLSNVGNAIIDYLKYGRPDSELKYIFLHLIPPYLKIKEPTMHSIVTNYMNLAGITNYQNKKHGPHALRHSLAVHLLNKKTPLPIISEVLGHKNIESTMIYLKVDVNSLKQCALDVPKLKTDFYDRKWGVFNG